MWTQPRNQCLTISNRPDIPEHREAKSVVEKLAEDLKAEFPGMTGFSPRNVWRMRAFYLAYTDEVRNLQSDLAKETLKNPDSFEFLTIADDAAEQELERGLVAHIRKFLIELGAGFAFQSATVPPRPQRNGCRSTIS